MRSTHAHGDLGAEVSGNLEHNDLGTLKMSSLPMPFPGTCGLQQRQTQLSHCHAAWQRPLWHWQATPNRKQAKSSSLKAVASSKTERRAEKLLKRKLAKKARLSVWLSPTDVDAQFRTQKNHSTMTLWASAFMEAATTQGMVDYIQEEARKGYATHGRGCLYIDVAEECQCMQATPKDDPAMTEQAGVKGSTFTDFGTAYVPVADFREITAKFHSLLNNISVGGMQIEPEALLGKPDNAVGPQTVPEAGASAEPVGVKATSDDGAVAAAESPGPSLKPKDSGTLKRLLRNVDCSRVFTWLGAATVAEDTGDRQYNPEGQEAILLLRVVAPGATMLRAGLVSFRQTSNADHALYIMTCSAEKDPWHPLVDINM